MTGKTRFIYKDNSMWFSFIDRQTGKQLNAIMCCNLMNELHEEKEQLKQQLKQQNDIILNWTENFIDFDKDELYVRDNNTEITLKNNNLLISVTLPQIKEHLKFHYIVTGRRFEREC